MFTLLGNTSATIQTESFNINVADGNYYIITAVDVPNVVDDEYLANNHCYGHGPLTIGDLPSCEDGTRNQGEEDVDCGGPCEASEICLDNWHVDYAHSPGIYQASNTVSSDGSIVDNAGVVIFRAGRKIDLLPGFTADASDGYYFKTEIGECYGNQIVPEETTQNLLYDASESHENSELITDVSALNSFELTDAAFKISNYPNPFNTKTTIEVSLEDSNTMSVYVHDLNGKILKTIGEKINLSQGRHQFTFDGSMYQPGIYYYTVIVGDKQQSGKLLLIK